MRRLGILFGAGLLAAACALPLPGSSLPTTAELINGASDSLAKATGLKITGTFTHGTDSYAMDFELAPPDAAHFTVSKNNVLTEGIQIGGKVYYRSPELVKTEFGSGEYGQQLAHAFNDRWVTSDKASLIDMGVLTDPSKVRATFLNTLTMRRKDNLDSAGVKVAELSTAEYKIYITEASPHHLVVIETTPGKDFDDFLNVALSMTRYDDQFDIQFPSNVVDLDEPNTWPPLYGRISISAARCNTPCTLSAVFQNYGGTVRGPWPPSYVSFTLSRSNNGSGDLGKCTKTITSDVADGKRLTVACTISSAAWTRYSGNYYYNAIPHNPAYE